MKIEELYEIINNENIEIHKWCFDELKALYVITNNKCHLGIDYSKIENETEEICILVEEISHHQFGFTYDVECDDIIRSKMEYKALKNAVNKLIPIDKFKSFYGQDISKYEVADELGVTEQFLERAYRLYTN